MRVVEGETIEIVTNNDVSLADFQHSHTRKLCCIPPLGQARARQTN